MPEAECLPIAAIPYAEGAYPDTLFAEIVASLQEGGVRLAGVIQHDLTRRDRSRCDMALEELTTGRVIGLSEDRGAAARGCRIDANGLAEAAALVEQAVVSGEPQLLLINKFGKIESEGGGLRQAIAEAICRNTPVVIGVPLRNLDAWDAFAGAFAQRIAADGQTLHAWIAANIGYQESVSGEDIEAAPASAA